MKNVRFWAYVNGGPVKVTLKPGQKLEHNVGGPTDEGWHSESTSWEYPADEEAVYRCWCSDGRDCDGRLTRGGEDRCESGRLSCGYDDPEDAGVVYPAWDEVRDHGVYDEYAQASGY